MSGKILTPAVVWAQRKHCIYLTVTVPENCKPQVIIDPESFSLECMEPGSGQKMRVELWLLQPVKPDESSHCKKGNRVEVILVKEDKEATFWPRLTAHRDKFHWLKVDFNRWKDEDEDDTEEEDDGSEYEDEENEHENKDDEEGKINHDDMIVKKLERMKFKEEPSRREKQKQPSQQKPTEKKNRKACSWAEGLSSRKQYEWLVDCYRMRIDDEYTWCGELRGGSLYDMEATAKDMVQDFLVFCSLAKQAGALPQDWDWPAFLRVAATLLPYAFEKSDAKEKYGSENVFTGMLGGRSLRLTGEQIYGSGIGSYSLETSELQQKMEEQMLHKKRTAQMVTMFGGEKAWNTLEREISRQLCRSVD